MRRELAAMEKEVEKKNGKESSCHASRKRMRK